MTFPMQLFSEKFQKRVEREKDDTLKELIHFMKHACCIFTIMNSGDKINHALTLGFIFFFVKLFASAFNASTLLLIPFCFFPFLLLLPLLSFVSVWYKY